MTKQWKPFKHVPNAQESKILKSNATTGNPSVLWEFVWEIKSWYGKWNLNEINELKAVKVINKFSILLTGVVVFVFTKFKHNLSTFTFRFFFFFFALSGKFLAVGSLELSNPPGWGTKKEGNALSFINTATFFTDHTVENCHFKHLG